MRTTQGKTKANTFPCAVVQQRCWSTTKMLELIRVIKKKVPQNLSEHLGHNGQVRFWKTVATVTIQLTVQDKSVTYY